MRARVIDGSTKDVLSSDFPIAKVVTGELSVLVYGGRRLTLRQNQRDF